jgi:hypothetical protein
MSSALPFGRPPLQAEDETAPRHELFPKLRVVIVTGDALLRRGPERSFDVRHQPTPYVGERTIALLVLRPQEPEAPVWHRTGTGRARSQGLTAAHRIFALCRLRMIPLHPTLCFGRGRGRPRQIS